MLRASELEHMGGDSHQATNPSVYGSLLRTVVTLITLICKSDVEMGITRVEPARVTVGFIV